MKEAVKKLKADSASLRCSDAFVPFPKIRHPNGIPEKQRAYRIRKVFVLHTVFLFRSFAKSASFWWTENQEMRDCFVHVGCSRHASLDANEWFQQDAVSEEFLSLKSSSKYKDRWGNTHELSQHHVYICLLVWNSDNSGFLMYVIVSVPVWIGVFSRKHRPNMSHQCPSCFLRMQQYPCSNAWACWV